MKAGNNLNIKLKIKSVVRRAFQPEPKPLILMYHRVADEPIDPSGTRGIARAFRGTVVCTSSHATAVSFG